MIVSADTEFAWLYKFRNLSSSYHQLVGVPVFQDGGSCGYKDGNVPVLGREELALVGNVQEDLDTNENIVCPNMQ